MSYKHEIMYLNSTRAYVRVGSTWYDSRADFDHKVGDPFLIGQINEILTHKEYTEKFPDSKNEQYSKVSDKTNSGGYIRKASSIITDAGDHQRIVEYAVNPQRLVIEANNFEIAD